MPADIKDLSMLIVEDNAGTRTLLSAMLNDLGVETVGTANDGLEALDVLNQDDGMPDVVLCDLYMPRMNGLDLVRKIRTMDCNVPFVMITVGADEETKSAARANGVTSFIEKPFYKEELEQKLTSLVRLIGIREAAVQM